jgi:hypothetical protein
VCLDVVARGGLHHELHGPEFRLDVCGRELGQWSSEAEWAAAPSSTG